MAVDHSDKYCCLDFRGGDPTLLLVQHHPFLMHSCYCGLLPMLEGFGEKPLRCVVVATMSSKQLFCHLLPKGTYLLWCRVGWEFSRQSVFLLCALKGPRLVLVASYDSHFGMWHAGTLFNATVIERRGGCCQVYLSDCRHVLFQWYCTCLLHF